jgi:hypothetical protein
MRISALIKKLKEVEKKNGDVHVVVQYRDEDGDYNGHDGILGFNIEEESISDYELYLEDFQDLGLHEKVLVL